MRRLLLKPCALLLCALFAAPALADNTADEADMAFGLGNKAYAKRQYQEALSAYFLSNRLVPNRNVVFNIARCFEALGRFDEAYRYYNDLLHLELPAADRKDVTSALSRLRPKVALLTVSSDPPGAELFIDREDLGSRGRTPQTLALTPGRHTIFVNQTGFHPAKTSAVLVRGKEAKQKLSLTKVLGKVLVEGQPAGASVKEAPEGPELCKVPCSVEVPPGKRLFYVSADGFLPGQFLVEIAADRPASIKAALVERPPPTGKVIVTANRDSALVRIDGKEAGFTPTVLLLPVGEHELTISAKELKTYSQRLTLAEDQELRVHAELRYAPPAVQAASKSLSSVDEAAASTTVITAEEIRAFGYQTLFDALAGVRGFYGANDRLYSYLGVRGFSPPGNLNTRLLILWDGHALNDVWAGQGYVGRDLSVDLSEVERIEVVRGPGSALYGTGAFFAVVNLVPRDGLGSRHLEGSGSLGGLSSQRARLTAAAEADQKSLLLSGAYYRAGGAEVTDLGDRGVALGLDGERSRGATARARWGSFTLQAQINSREKDIPTAPYETGVNLAGTRVTDARGFAELRYDRELPRLGLSARAYYDGSRYQGFWQFEAADAASPPEELRDSGLADWLGAEARGRLALFTGNTLTAGLESQLQLRVEQTVFGADESVPAQSYGRTLMSAYLLDEWRLHPKATLSLGLRLDKYLELEELPITPRLALILHPYAAGLTKVVAGTAFRAPTIYELYYSDEGLTQKAPERLAPETIATFEIEHAHDLSEELRVTVAGYHNRIDQLVALLPEEGPAGCGEPAGSQPCLVNVNAPGLVRAWGAEAQLRWQPGRLSLLDLSYSYVNLVGAGEELRVNSPAHLVSARLMMPLGVAGVRLATQATYQSARPNSDAGEVLLLNAGLTGEAGPLRYLAHVENALDARYSLPAGEEAAVRNVPQYGRRFMLELSASY